MDAHADQQDAGGSRAAVWKRRLRRAALAGATLSIAIHLFIMLAAYFVRVGPGGPAASGEAPAEVEFAVMTQAEFAATMAERPTLETSAVAESAQPELPDLALLDTSATESLKGLSDEALRIEIDAGGGDLSAGGGDAGGSLGGGGGGGASFFGLEAQGSRFAYIVDRSSSMRDGNRMQRTQWELIESIEGLVETGEFLVVFYSNDAEPLGGDARWTEATPRNKAAAGRQIRQVQPSGGTRPMPAFERVFGQRVKPDAIYFMTDGRFDEGVPGLVASLNARARIPVHCLLVGDVGVSEAIRDEVSQMMQRIAADSGGTFLHIRETAP